MHIERRVLISVVFRTLVTKYTFVSPPLTAHPSLQSGGPSKTAARLFYDPTQIQSKENLGGCYSLVYVAECIPSRAESPPTCSRRGRKWQLFYHLFQRQQQPKSFK